MRLNLNDRISVGHMRLVSLGASRIHILALKQFRVRKKTIHIGQRLCNTFSIYNTEITVNREEFNKNPCQSCMRTFIEIEENDA